MPYDGEFFSSCLASYIVLMNEKQEVCLMRRANTGWKDGYFGLPAGKVERNETFLETAVREAKEECDITLDSKDVRLFLIQNRFDDNQIKTKDWVDLFFVVSKWEGEPNIAEPEKCDHIEWFSLDNLPEKIVSNVTDALNYLKDGDMSFGLFSDEYNYFNKKVA
jgi:8-oxo-dGTP diphosphatase